MEILGLFLTAIMLAVIVVAVMTWPSMILLGVAHSFDPRIPALGFHALFLVGLAIRFLFAGVSAEAS